MSPDSHGFFLRDSRLPLWQRSNLGPPAPPTKWQTAQIQRQKGHLLCAECPGGEAFSSERDRDGGHHFILGITSSQRKRQTQTPISVFTSNELTGCRKKRHETGEGKRIKKLPKLMVTSCSVWWLREDKRAAIMVLFSKKLVLSPTSSKHKFHRNKRSLHKKHFPLKVTTHTLPLEGEMKRSHLLNVSHVLVFLGTHMSLHSHRCYCIRLCVATA